MLNYKIVASDLDGTLLNSKGQVSEKNWDAVRKMTERGVLFVPCTGRTLNEMNPNIRDHPCVRYIIHSDGAVIYDKKTDRRITMCMPQTVSHQLLDILNDFPNLPAVRYQRNVYMNAEQINDDVLDQFHIKPYSRNIVIPLATKKEGFGSFCREMEEIEMLGTFFESTEDRDACIARLEATGDYLFARWENMDYCEIFYKDAGKGNALLRLADELEIDRKETIGVGDSTNDLTLIQSAGFGLCMANGHDALKNLADEIICNNDEHTIKYILEHYIC